jgi:hypothetical protein
MDLGYADTMRRRTEVEAFLHAEDVEPEADERAQRARMRG